MMNKNVSAANYQTGERSGTETVMKPDRTKCRVSRRESVPSVFWSMMTNTQWNLPDVGLFRGEKQRRDHLGINPVTEIVGVIDAVARLVPVFFQAKKSFPD